MLGLDSSQSISLRAASVATTTAQTDQTFMSVNALPAKVVHRDSRSERRGDIGPQLPTAPNLHIDHQPPTASESSSS
jgi:hypothetical protein